MAVSQIWAIHSTPGETLKYIARFDKSDRGSLVFSNQCSNIPELADIQMQAHRKRFGKDNNILLHHGFVAFKKNEIDRETAYKFAKIFMDRHFPEYQYFGSIHVDTEHIHFNFAINAVAFDGRKYNGCKTSLALMRAEVDRCCEEMGLSVVIPKGTGVSYKEWKEQKENNSWKSQIKVDIDLAIQKSNSFDEFLYIMRNDGYYIKQGENVKYMVVKKQGMKMGCRVRKLGVEYTEESIKERIKYKEFNFMSLKSELRKPKKKMKAVEKELMSIYYRKPTLSNSIAMGVHLLNSYITGNKYKILRYSPPKKKRLYNQYQCEVKKLSNHVNYCYEHEIKSRNDLKFLINDLEEKYNSSHSIDVKKELNICYEIENTLNEIRDRDIVENFKSEVEKEEKTTQKKVDEKER